MSPQFLTKMYISTALAVGPQLWATYSFPGVTLVAFHTAEPGYGILSILALNRLHLYVLLRPDI